VSELYDPLAPELVAARARAKQFLRRYNATTEADDRDALLREFFAEVGVGAWVEPPFFCDYGSNIAVGDRFYANAGCTILDCARVTIGDNALFGPNVQLYAATHPVDASLRRDGLEYAAPITIGDDVWIGGAAVVLPGVAIGDRAVVGAGSVVTRNVAADAVVAGNPARPLNVNVNVEV
jgi:maltose O-acetyltransferase